MDAFRLGGWGMYPTLVFGLIFVVGAIQYARRPEPHHRPLVISLGVLTLIVGSLGFVTGLIATMAHTEPPNEPRVALVGLGESLHNVSLALMLLVVGTIAAVIGNWRFAQRGNS